MTAISFANPSKKEDGLVPGYSGSQSLSKKTQQTQKPKEPPKPKRKNPHVLSIHNSLLIFKQCDYPVKVSEGPFWKWDAGPAG